MNDRLRALYKTVILEHSNNPMYFEKKEVTQFVLKAHSPICGDRFEFFFDIDDEVVNNLSFYGHGCAISKASASIMVRKLRGQSIRKALTICAEFYNYVNIESALPEPMDEEFEAFSAAKIFPERKKCATLSWDEMSDFLTKYQNQ